MRVLFIRHGESRSNAASGVVSLPAEQGDRLSELGWSQARAAGRHLAGRERPDLVLASPMRRSQETAEAIVAELPAGPEIRFEIEPSIIELSESRDYAALPLGEQIEQRWATRMERNAHDPEHSIDGGESFADMVRRVRRAKAALETSGAELVLAVSHGIFLRFFWMETVLGAALTPDLAGRMWQLGSVNCGICGFERRAGEPDSIKDPSLDGWRATSWMSRPWDPA